MGHGKGKKPKT
uniref:Uncharacterized protein n=1 Tax=Anguilla anguilla TaxID=7936 RepID=A0A0E9S103_ANGAN